MANPAPPANRHGDGYTAEPAASTNPMRLIMLRYVAIIGQSAAILLAAFYLQIDLPLWTLFTIVGAELGFNIASWLHLRTGRGLSAPGFAAQLLVDVLALTALLYFSGGATNPFVSLFLIPLMVSATVLPGHYTWMLTAITVVCYSALLQNHVPLPHHHMDPVAFDHHVIGMWLGFVLSAGLIAYFVVGMGRILRQQQEALARAREQALRDTQLVQLGALAASTAHEMGTPLGTMALLTEELEEVCNDAQMHARLSVLRNQIARCKSALGNLSAAAGGVQLTGGGLQPAADYLLGLLREWQSQHPAVRLDLARDTAAPSPLLLADRTLSQALCNILDNATKASPQQVAVHIAWDAESCRLRVCDRGPGLTQEARHRIGREPYSEREGGMGLGLFLTHAIIRRLGGTVELYDREGGGLCTLVQLPCTPSPPHKS